MALLDCIEVETGSNPKSSVIWLHGLGADGHDFEPIVPELDLPPSPIRFVFPNAPVRPVTINGGMVMRAWYDAYGDGRQDEAGIMAAQSQIEALIAREKTRGTPASRLVLAGFSQGGAIAFQTALRHPERIAGIMALSTYLPMADKLKVQASAMNRDVPIFMAHGAYDPMIPIDRAKESKTVLESLGYKTEWHEYRMDHSVNAEEITDIGKWLREIFR